MNFNPKLLSVSAFALCVALNSAQAEITLQSTGETLTGDMTISQDMGLTEGTNLLHTFLAFNVDSGESATFTGSNSITNIIARVSGESATNIDGLLRSTITDANLFLINPNGVAFGAGASLDINGSLHVSTADSLVFADDSRLLVSDSGASGFTAAAPAAFGFSTDAAAITFNGTQISTLEADRVSALSIVGGDISLSESAITVAGGAIDLLATRGTMDVSVDTVGRDYAALNLGDVLITNDEFIAGKRDLDTSGDAAGALSIAGDTVTLERAFVFADTEGAGSGGAIDIYAAAQLELTAGARITTDATGEGSGGNLLVNAGAVILSGTNTALAASTLSQGGPAGTIEVNASSIDISDSAQIASVTSTNSDGGDIVLNTGTLNLASGGQISGQATSRGQGADVVIVASQAVSIDGAGADAGDAAGIRVDSLNFLPFFTGGDAGDISITAPSLTLTGNAVIAAQASLPSSGAPGAITLNVDNLTVQGGSTISTLTSSGSDAGAITVIADEVTLTGVNSSLVSTTRQSGTGGDINIVATSVSVMAGASADTSTSGAGAAGNINISVSDSVSVSDAGTVIASQSSSDGQGGGVNISGDQLMFDQEGLVSVTSTGEGDAGDINLTALTRLEILDGAQVQTNAELSGGGNITVEVIDTIYLRDSTLIASAGGLDALDNGGNINIDPRFLILNNASIVAQAVAGNGGQIELIAENYIADVNSFIDATSELGNDGDIRIRWIDNSIKGVIGTLSANFDAVSQISSDACSARNLESRSSLLIQKQSERLTAPGDLRAISGETC